MFTFGKDGGPESKVWGHFFEIKKLFSVVLLRFENGSREAYHSHAFNSLSLVIGPGFLEEKFLDGETKIHKAGDLVKTQRHDFHKVTSHGRTWVLTFRGPWNDTWQEFTDERGFITLSHGRVEA
jgi:hypothetical protein